MSETSIVYENNTHIRALLGLHTLHSHSYCFEYNEHVQYGHCVVAYE